MEFPFYIICCFSHAVFNILSLSLIFYHFNYNVSWCVLLWVNTVLDFQCLLDLNVCFLSQVMEVFIYYVFTYVFSPFLSFFFYLDTYNANISELDIIPEVS